MFEYFVIIYITHWYWCVPTKECYLYNRKTEDIKYIIDQNVQLFVNIDFKEGKKDVELSHPCCFSIILNFKMKNISTCLCYYFCDCILRLFTMLTKYNLAELQSTQSSFLINHVVSYNSIFYYIVTRKESG